MITERNNKGNKMNKHQNRNIVKLEGSFIKAYKENKVESTTKTMANVRRATNYLVTAYAQNGATPTETIEKLNKLKESV